jgi:cell division protein FtsQ
LEKKKVRKNKPKPMAGEKRTVRPGTGRLKVFLTAGGFFCLGLLFVLGHDVLTQGRMFAAKEIAVTGNHRLTFTDVLALAGIEPGANIFAVNLGVARERLLANDWVAEARVRREIPDRLVVRVREHEPAALLDLGETYVMSREGTIIKRSEPDDGFVLPRVTGLTYSDLPLAGEAPTESFTALMQVLRVARGDGGALSWDRLKSIDVDSGLGITLYAAGPVKSVRIGFANYDQKYRRVERLLASLDRRPEDPALEILAIDSDSRIVAGPFSRNGEG